MDLNKISYWIDGLRRFNEKRICPYCQNASYEIEDRKYGVLTLLKCKNCQLQYRHPYETTVSNRKFYQKQYTQKGLTTDLPNKETLDELIQTNFAQSNKNFHPHIKLIKLLLKKKDVKIVDYGANWGYTSYQFNKEGFKVESYEISVPRAQFGNQYLELSIKTEENQLRDNQDVFFSSHVIEHHPKISDMISFAKKILTNDGIFIAFSPNGSSEFRVKEPEIFHRFWGQVHPNLLSQDFYRQAFRNNPYYITSNPYNLTALQEWDQQSQVYTQLDGVELLAICLPNRILNTH